LAFVGNVGDKRDRRTALASDHRDGLFGGLAQDIDNHHLGARARQQQCRGPAVADAGIGRAAAGDDRHLAGEAGIVFGPHFAVHILSHPISAHCAGSKVHWIKDLCHRERSEAIPYRERRDCFVAFRLHT
jgi:hypothetical protein